MERRILGRGRDLPRGSCCVLLLVAACSGNPHGAGKPDSGSTGAGGKGSDAGGHKTDMTSTMTPSMTDAGHPAAQDAGKHDAGAQDSGARDSGTHDSGAPDSGTPDSGTPDSGTPDSGTPDSGTPDSGTPDSGTPDSGHADPCANLSNTCATAGKSCDGNTLVTCAANQDACLVETRTDCTVGNTDLCDDSLTPPACAVDPCAGLSNACTTAGTSCDGNTLVTCAANQDSCLVATRTDCTATQGKNTCSSAAPAACGFDPCRDAQGAPKSDVCIADQTSCAADILVTCVPDSDGCPIAQHTDCTTVQNKNFCDHSISPPACGLDPCKGVTNCLTAGSTCRATEIVDCVANTDGCLVEHVTDCTVGGTVNKTCDATGHAPACVSCVDDAACTGKAEGDKDCNSNALRTCSDTDGDGCLNAHSENCGSTFTCDATNGCVYSGGDTCSSPAEALLRHQGSYGPFNTTGGGNDYTAYTCPGLIFAFAAAAPDRLFAVDVAPKTVVTLGLTGPTGFTGTGAWLLLLTSCADGATTAEASCKAVSATTVKYANETDADARVYLLVDADGANNVGTFGLTLDTHPFVCGDGKLDGSEACDDGNIFSGDGCTPACALESGYQCTANSPSVCTQRPTNGVCANVMCSAFPATPPNGTQMCCTSKQTCGVAYPFVYGAGCIERDQPGKADAACPNQPAVFYFPALTGCCRPDNTCGLQALDPSVGTDCVERTEVWLDMQDGYGSLFYNGPFAAIPCNF